MLPMVYVVKTWSVTMELFRFVIDMSMPFLRFLGLGFSFSVS